MNGCEDCLFSYGDLPVRDVAARTLALAAQLSARLTVTEPVALRRWPAPDVWSPLEYACHLRDVLTVQRERILLALAEDTPAFASMQREERVERDRYNQQSPDVVATQIGSAAAALATTEAALTDAEWRRTGSYPWPSTEPRTMAWVARHTVHELIHHLRDIDAGLRAATAAGAS